jgi:hypothetical protein
MANIFRRIRRPSLRQGVIFGLIVGVIEIVVGFASAFLQQDTVQSLLSTLLLAGYLGGGYLAGERAARETGKLGSGVLAGLWAGFIGGIVASLVPFALTLIYLPTEVAGLQQAYNLNKNNFPGMTYSDITGSYVMEAFAINLLTYIFLYAIIALVGGTVGGFLGRRRALRMPVSTGRDESDEPDEKPALWPRNTRRSARVTDSAE